MNYKKKQRTWRICIMLVLILIVLGYTPLMIPRGIYTPKILGIPYSLWTSFLVTLALVVLTYIGARVHPGQDEGEEDA